MQETIYSVNSPASGASKGRLLSKKEEKGSITSRPTVNVVIVRGKKDSIPKVV